MVEKIKIAWGITGAGDKIKDTKEVMEKISNEKPVDFHVYVSVAGEQVLKWYRIYDEMKSSFKNFSAEKNSNSPFLAGNLQVGKYEALIIAPATSNTVAKISCSIADTLLTNSAIMALKAYVPVYVMPVDFEEGEIETELPSGEKFMVRVRKEDVENVNKLRKIDGISIIESPEDIESQVSRIIEKE